MADASELALEAEVTALPSAAPFRDALKSLVRHKAALLGAVVLLTVVAMALFSPWIAPFDPEQQIPWESRRAPWTQLEASGRFVILGTDHLGRDLLSRIIYASRVTLIVAFTAVVFSGVIGVALGVAAGYFGRWIDTFIMRLVDIFLAFPFELLALSVVAVTGPSLAVVVVVMALRVWVIYARVIRGAVLSVKEKDFVQGAVAIGATQARVIFVHVLPNVLTPAIVIATLYVGRLILIESSLSFLGIGVPVTTPTWGGILGDGRSYIDTAWWIAFFPGLAIMITVLSANLLGDWLRDHLDPRIQT